MAEQKSNQPESNWKNSWGKTIFYGLLTALLIWSAYNLFYQQRQSINTIPISQLVQQINNGKIQSIEVSDRTITAKTIDGQDLKTVKEKGVGINDYKIDPAKTEIKIKDAAAGEIWYNLLSIVVPIIAVILFFTLMARSAQGMNIKAMSFGKSTARLFAPGKKKTTFADVAGLKEAKQELMEVVEFLKHPERFKKVKAEIPRGVLLIGPPGTGKTLMAKAAAGEADVPFFSVSASEFVEMFVGVGAARTRDSFAKAKRNAPAILFIDELDAVGRQRGAGLGGSHDEREQTLNQILVEMDGFDTDDRVIILGATNRPDVLDPALLRPGRFDRRVVLSLPNIADRREILEIHTEGKPLANDVNLQEISRSTVGFSGADLKNVANEAAILAARATKAVISHHNFEQAIEKVMLGPERKSQKLSEHEKELAATHEVGHAVVGHLLPNCDPIQKISIVSRGLALGYTWNLPVADRHIYSQKKFEDDLAMMLAGRMAEKLLFGEVTTGAQNDLEKATKLAREMVTVYGMSSKLGPVTLGQKEELVFLGRELGEHKNYSEEKAAEIDREIYQILHQAQTQAQKILQKNLSVVRKITKLLLAKETLNAREFARCFPKSKNN